MILVEGSIGVGTAHAQISALEMDEAAFTTRWHMAVQVGVGADLQLGNVTLSVEIVDYLTGFTNSSMSLQHDAFVFLTLGIPVY